MQSTGRQKRLVILGRPLIMRFLGVKKSIKVWRHAVIDT